MGFDTLGHSTDQMQKLTAWGSVIILRTKELKFKTGALTKHSTVTE